jgi:ATP-dependent helicase/nuclease subunit B
VTSPSRLALAKPIEQPEAPVVEMVASTRRDEARSAMALVKALREREVLVRDIAVVVRSLDAYEEPLCRAAFQYGIAPVCWTQLRVTQTRPYALVESVCDVLAAEEMDSRTLLRPVMHRWTPADADTDEWPVAPKTVLQARYALDGESRPLNEWVETVEASDDVDRRVVRFVRWVDAVPEADPDAVRSVLDDVVEGYAACGLPATQANDSPALLDTEIDARAVVRVRTLVRQLPGKYRNRLDEGSMERSWGDVAELADTIVTQRPGRREHSNARALDILEANDVWGLDIPYVVAVGLTAKEWPQQTDSPLEPEFQEAVLQGEGPAAKLAPSTSWTDGRDRDHFADTLGAGGRAVVVTRHMETANGDVVHPSSFLEFLDTEAVSDSEMRQLQSTDRELPAPVRATLPESEAER